MNSNNRSEEDEGIIAETESYFVWQSEEEGELVFHLGGREHRLAAFADSASRDFFVMFWDSTATTMTYEGGRYLHVPLPNDDGWTVIDFNRAYNPPCVFTPYSTCALPPPGNRLGTAIEAGEKRARFGGPT